jgi:tetratricopeptide (TPR) repeat protein
VELQDQIRREPKRIGELLIEAGIIRSEELPVSLKEAADRSLRLGEVLVMMRYVTSEDLEAVLQAQASLNDGSISDEQALDALRIASGHRISFDEALRRSSAAPPERPQETEEALLRPLLEELDNAEQMHGPQNREIGNICLRIGDVYARIANYAEAERHYRRALQIFERSFGQRNLKVASCLSKLGDLFFAQKKYSDAETIYWRVLDITQSAWGSEHNDVAHCHKSLARLLEAQGRLKEAEQFYMSALRIMEKVGGADHPELTDTLRNLASFWMRQGKRPERKRLGDLLAESGMLQPEQLQLALQKSSQSNSPLGQTLVRLNLLTEAELRPALQAQLLVGDGVLPAPIATRALRHSREQNISFDEALRALGWDPEKFTGEELKILIDAAEELMSAEVALGFEHAGVAVLTAKLADLYVEQRKFNEAEPLYKRAIAILEKFFGPKDAEVASALAKIANLYTLQGKYIEAEKALWRALEIRQLAFGQDHVDVAECLDSLADVHEKQANPEQAQRFYQSSVSIKEKVLGKDHPRTAETWTKLAYMHFLQDDYAEAEGIYLRLIRARQRSENTDDLAIADLLEKLAQVYSTQGNIAKALTQQELALEIHEEKSVSSERTAELMEKYSILLDKAGRSEESRKIMERAQIMKRMRA